MVPDSEIPKLALQPHHKVYDMSRDDTIAMRYFGLLPGVTI